MLLCYQYIHTEYIAYHYNNNSYHILKNNYVLLTKKYIIKVIGVAELLYECIPIDNMIFDSGYNISYNGSSIY